MRPARTRRGKGSRARRRVRARDDTGMQDRPWAPRRNAAVPLLAVSLVAGLLTMIWAFQWLATGVVATILLGMIGASGACLIAALILSYVL